MKKTNKIIMGVTALAMAFSACAFTACNSQPNDGSIKGNYQEATAEQVNTALSTVNQEQLFGDTSAEDYKFGIELTSSFNALVSSESGSSSIGLSADYKMLVNGSDSAFSYKGEGNLSMKAENTPTEGTKSTNEMALNLWQDDVMTYAKMTMASSEDEEGKEPTPTTIKFDVSQLVSSLIPSGGSDVTIPTLPEGVELPGSITTPDVSSLDLVTAVKALNDMGATVAMDTTRGIKLKISITEDVILNLMADMMGSTVEQASSKVAFTKCNLDFYLSIDKDGLFEATSIVADIEASSAQSTTATAASTVKLEGYMSLKVNSNVTPEIPETLKTDKAYMDITSYLPIIIEGMIGNGSLLG